MSEQPAEPRAAPPRGAIVAYEYHSARPTPGPRTQLVLVTGHETAADGSTSVRGLVLGHVEDQATFTLDQLAPAP